MHESWLRKNVISGLLVAVLIATGGQYFRDPEKSAVLGQIVADTAKLLAEHNRQHIREGLPEEMAALKATVHQLVAIQRTSVESTIETNKLLRDIAGTPQMDKLRGLKKQ